MPRANEQAEFEWHVEPRQPFVAQFGTGEIVNRQPTLSYQSQQSLEPCLARSRGVQRATRFESAVENGENDGVEDGPILGIERAVDEDLLALTGSH